VLFIIYEGGRRECPGGRASGAHGLPSRRSPGGLCPVRSSWS